MDFKAFKKQLSRIERAYDLLHKENDITDVEIDLLRAYAKKLYELTLDGNGESELVSPPTKEKKIEEPKPLVKKDEPEKSVSSETLISEEVKNDSSKSGKPQEKDEPEKSVSSEIAALFETKEAVELSDKLSISAIDHIENAMSINEKIFAINELFDGDNEAFKACLAKLDSQKDFASAKSYLVKDVIVKYAWIDEEKKKKAMVFIDLVNRKFSN